MKKFVYILMLFLLLALTACSSKVEVKFNSDGGSSVDSIEVVDGKIEKPEDPTKYGYMFLGWYLNDSEFDFNQTITKTITLKAKWAEAITLTISGAGVTEQEILVPKGVEYDIETPTREGYKFISWIDTTTNLILSSPYIFYEDTFIQPKWEKKDQYAIYYYNGGQQLKYEYAYEGDEYTPYVPTLDGFTFVCWCSDQELTTEMDFTKLGRTNNVYAKWESNTYHIYFTSGRTKSIEVKYNQRVGTLPNADFDQKTCTFVGWSYNGKYITELTTYKYTTDITVDAVIQAKSTFVIDGTKKSVTYIIGDVTPYVTAEKTGYIFAGWYDNSAYTGDPIYVIEDDSYAGKILYAKFISSDDENNTYSKKIVELLKSYYLDLYNDKLVYENLGLKTYDDFYGSTLTWASSNNSIINTLGVLKRTKENQDATLTLTISYGNISEEVEINLTVKAQPYKDISKSVVASYCYTGTWGSQGVNDILLDTADVIYLSFAVPQSDGSIILSNDYLNKYNSFRDKALEKGVRVSMCIGDGGTADTFTEIAKDDLKRSVFVQQIVDYITLYGFAGVDIDWEYPAEADKTYYTLLMHDIYEAVKSMDPEYLVTSAIPAGPWGYPKFDLTNSINYMDYINMMSYDMQCSGVNGKLLHHCALYKSSMTYSMCSVDETVTYWNKTLSVPLNKIVIGGAFYGKYSTCTSLTGTITSDSVGVSIKYTTIAGYLKDSNWKEYWDDTAKVPYLYNATEKIFITYENAKSLEAKCDYIASKGVRGLMWWDYGSDTTGDLITAVNGKLSKIK